MTQDRKAEGRRTFLKLAGLGSLAAGAAAATAVAAPVSAEAETVEHVGKGYSETRHVKTFYDSCRF